jgi:hypothetical protein
MQEAEVGSESYNGEEKSPNREGNGNCGAMRLNRTFGVVAKWYVLPTCCSFRSANLVYIMIRSNEYFPTALRFKYPISRLLLFLTSPVDLRIFVLLIFSPPTPLS